MSQKQNLAFWVDNQCYSATNREIYIKNLQKILPIDDFGTCFDEFCDEKCLKKLSNSYFFIIILEPNSCSDYISEIFWNSLKLNLVPVVFGASNYSGAPENSFINIKDFANTQNLANFLLHTAKNEVIYRSYFKWKNKYKFHPETEPICQLCQKLNNDSEPQKSYENVYNWFYYDAENEPYCPEE